MNSTQHLSEILKSASDTHHSVYKKIEGNDPEWALWYANWLMTLSDLPSILPKLKTQSELCFMLVLLDKDYTRTAPETTWEAYYADRLVTDYS